MLHGTMLVELRAVRDEYTTSVEGFVAGATLP